jgi:Pyridoxamine 5'-phosphate oxidase
MNMPVGWTAPGPGRRVQRPVPGGSFGRLAIVEFGGLMVFLVNYVLDHDLVVRTDPGTKLDAAREREQVAFEVDAAEEDTRTGWSVVVRGTLADLTDPAHLARLRALPSTPGPWREEPVPGRAAAQGHRPPHQDPRRSAVYLVGLTGPRPVMGVLLLVAWRAGGWVSSAGWWMVGLGLGGFVPLAAAVLAWRAVEDADPAGG